MILLVARNGFFVVFNLSPALGGILDYEKTVIILLVFCYGVIVDKLIVPSKQFVVEICMLADRFGKIREWGKQKMRKLRMKFMNR